MKYKYVVAEGKHEARNAEGHLVVYRKGDIIMLTEGEAAKFPNKFERLMVPEEGVPEEKGKQVKVIKTATSGQ